MKAVGTFWCVACKEHFSDCEQRVIFIDGEKKNEVICPDCDAHICMVTVVPNDVQQDLFTGRDPATEIK